MAPFLTFIRLQRPLQGVVMLRNPKSKDTEQKKKKHWGEQRGDGKSRENRAESITHGPPQYHPGNLAGFFSVFFLLHVCMSLAFRVYGIVFGYCKQVLDQTASSSLEKVTWTQVILIAEQLSKQATIGISIFIFFLG